MATLAVRRRAQQTLDFANVCITSGWLACCLQNCRFSAVTCRLPPLSLPLFLSALFFTENFVSKCLAYGAITSRWWAETPQSSRPPTWVFIYLAIWQQSFAASIFHIIRGKVWAMTTTTPM